MTLACEDGQQVEAHKVILAASSPFFQKLLGRNKHPHTLIYMRGVKFDDLLAIVDFLYWGEAKVFKTNLDSFLTIAGELQLKGLIGKTNEKVKDFEEDKKYQTPTLSPDINANAKIPKASFKSSKIHSPGENKTFAIHGIPGNFSGDLD